MAGVILAGREVAEHRAVAVRTLRRVGSWTPRLVPPVGAVMVFVAGAVLLISGATPAVQDRLLMVTDLMPLPVVEASHILGSMAGLGLLILARGLIRRLDAAWLLSVVLLAAGIVASLTKGFDYEEALLLTVFLAVLLPCRPEFHRKAALTDFSFTPGWLLAVTGVVAGSIWLTLFSFRHVEYANSLWWQFAVLDDAPRSLRAGFIVVLGIVAISLAHLLRAAPAQPHPATPEELEKVRSILANEPRSDAAIALLGDKAFLFDDTGTAFLMYGVRGHTWIALGDPVGTPAQQAELIWRFREMVDRQGGRPAFYQVSADALPCYLDVGMSLLKLGEEARVDLAEFSLEGPANKDLRYIVRRAERDGLSFEVIPRDARARHDRRVGRHLQHMAEPEECQREAIFRRVLRSGLSGGIRPCRGPAERAGHRVRQSVAGGERRHRQHRPDALPAGRIAVHHGLPVHQASALGQGAGLSAPSASASLPCRGWRRGLWRRCGTESALWSSGAARAFTISVV